MPDRTPATTRSLFVLIVALFLLSPAAAAGAEDVQEVLKGTVVELKNGILTLKGVRFQDETIPPRSVTVQTDKGTAFFDGPIQVSKESIVADLLVLVRCTMTGPDRKAVLVRIIGGKKS